MDKYLYILADEVEKSEEREYCRLEQGQTIDLKDLQGLRIIGVYSNSERTVILLEKEN